MQRTRVVTHRLNQNKSQQQIQQTHPRHLPPTRISSSTSSAASSCCAASQAASTELYTMGCAGRPLPGSGGADARDAWVAPARGACSRECSGFRRHACSMTAAATVQDTSARPRQQPRFPPGQHLVFQLQRPLPVGQPRARDDGCRVGQAVGLAARQRQAALHACRCGAGGAAGVWRGARWERDGRRAGCKHTGMHAQLAQGQNPWSLLQSNTKPPIPSLARTVKQLQRAPPVAALGGALHQLGIRQLGGVLPLRLHPLCRARLGAPIVGRRAGARWPGR